MTRALADRSLSEVSTNKRVSGFQGRSVWTRIPPELTFSVEANIRVKGCVALESIARNVLRFRFSFRSSIVEPSARTQSTSRAVEPLPLRHGDMGISRSEEHTSELQSPCNLVCRLLLEKKKKHK